MTRHRLRHVLYVSLALLEGLVLITALAGLAALLDPETRGQSWVKTSHLTMELLRLDLLATARLTLGALGALGALEFVRRNLKRRWRDELVLDP